MVCCANFTTSLLCSVGPVSKALEVANMDPWVTLRDEYFILQEELLQNDTPIHRRNFIRAVCSNVEGTLNWLMYMLSENLSGIDEEQMLALKEKKRVKKEGRIVEVPLRNGTVEKIKFVFKLLAKFPGGDKMDFGDNNFSKLRNSFEVRDRLMHPKRDADLSVTEEEVQTMIDGYRWYITNYQATLKSIEKALAP